MADIEDQQTIPGATDTRLHRWLTTPISRLRPQKPYDTLELGHVRQSSSATSVTPEKTIATRKRDKKGQQLFLEKLFALPDERLEEFQQGIDTYLHFVERSFQPLLDHGPTALNMLAKQPDTANQVTFWTWANAILDTVRSLDKADTSILNIYNSMVATASLSGPVFTAEQKNFLLLAIFVTTCWTTLICTPRLNPDTFRDPVQHEQKLFETQETSNAVAVQASDTARRPFSKMIKGFRRHTSDNNNVTASPSDDLHESTLNYYSLYTIGRVRIEWVSDLTRHLEFDRQRRCICIFKYPSFCVAMALRHKSEKAFESAFQESFTSTESNETNFQRLLAREVLLSYRLIFAQDRRSRSQSKEEIAHIKRVGMDYDPFLERMCCHVLDRDFRESTTDMWPPSCQDFDDRLREQDVYSVQEDFPVFGARLLRLQQYNLRQQPSRIRDLWRDRRNPLQWYTFWAVLWVGGLSLLMAILQLSVAIAQLYFQVSVK